VTENDFASVVPAGIVGDCSTCVDTGSYSLNALLSGSLYGGVPSNKITCLAGSEAVGKTFFALSIAKNYLNAERTAGALVISLLSEPLAESSISLRVDKLPSESRNIIIL
jgi:RecA/RadA recombinase